MARPEISRGPLWKIAVQTSPEAEDAVSELLETLFGNAVSSYTDVETATTEVAVYVASKPDPTRTLSSLKTGIHLIREHGLQIGPGNVSCRKLRRQDWAESWKRHFKPIRIGSALLIRPSWRRIKLAPRQKEIVLDPGLSFGTGQHPTTSFCLKQIVRLRDRKRSFLDIGTGSGILSIAAAKLGYDPVEAFDFDRESVRIAVENARRNRVSGKVRIIRDDITKRPRRSRRRFDVICANLISTLLISERNRIVAMLKPGGTVVLAGILASEFGIVRKAYERAGLEMTSTRIEKEWQSGAFRNPSGS